MLADYRTVLERTAKLENEAYGATQYTSYDVRMALADAMLRASPDITRALRQKTTEAAMLAKVPERLALRRTAVALRRTAVASSALCPSSMFSI